MDGQNRSQRELEQRYEELKEEIERRGGYHREFNKDVVPLAVKVQVLEDVLRYDDKINGKRREQ